MTLAGRAAARRRGRARPRARRGRRDRRRRGCPRASRAPTAATGTARARSRSTSPSRAACRGRTRPRAGRARCTSAGSFAEIVAAEREINRGRMPERPFVLVCQQSLADPTRARGRRPPGVGLRARPARLHRRRDRGAARPDRTLRPGPARADPRDRRALDERARRATTPTTSAATSSPARTRRWQTVIRPRLALDPYSTGIPGVFICSAATPPGARRARDERLQRRRLGATRPGVYAEAGAGVTGAAWPARARVRDSSLAGAPSRRAADRRTLTT